jgi:hypothetical protein
VFSRLIYIGMSFVCNLREVGGLKRIGSIFNSGTRAFYFFTPSVLLNQ